MICRLISSQHCSRRCSHEPADDLGKLNQTHPVPAVTAGEDGPIYERLGRLEGLLIGLQAGLGQQRDSVAQFLSRIERLEQRQVQLEAHQVTREDLRDLRDTVDRLVNAEATARGSRSFADGMATKLAPWGALLVAVLALLGVGQNRKVLDNRLPPTETHRTP